MTDPTLHVFARRGDMPRHVPVPVGEHHTTLGTALYGDRFADVTFSDYAVFEINNAIKTILWLRHIACRFSGEELPSVLQKFLDTVDEVDRTAESSHDPITIDELKAAIKRVENEPPRPDVYQDSPEMRKALGVELCEHCNKLHKNGLSLCPLYSDDIGIVKGEA